MFWSLCQRDSVNVMLSWFRIYIFAVCFAHCISNSFISTLLLHVNKHFILHAETTATSYSPSSNMVKNYSFKPRRHSLRHILLKIAKHCPRNQWISHNRRSFLSTSSSLAQWSRVCRYIACVHSWRHRWMSAQLTLQCFIFALYIFITYFRSHAVNFAFHILPKSRN